MSNTLRPIMYVEWIESENGWGIRPDGCSIHKTSKNFKSFMKRYWKGMPKRVPYEYSAHATEPRRAYVRQWLYDEIEGSGIRIDEDLERDLKHSGSLVFKRRKLQAKKKKSKK